MHPTLQMEGPSGAGAAPDLVDDATCFKRVRVTCLEDPCFGSYNPLLRAMSHSLANLLMPVCEYPQLLQRLLPAASPELDISTKIIAAADHLRQLNDELVRFCHGLEGEPVELDLVDLAHEVVNGLHEEMGTLLLPTIRIHAGAVPATLTAPHEAAFHMIRDCCLHAFHATEPPQVIEISLGHLLPGNEGLAARAELPAGRFVLLRCTHDGRQPDEEEWADLFKPFARRCAHEWNMLGLSAVYRTVHHLQGALLRNTRREQGNDLVALLPTDSW